VTLVTPSLVVVGAQTLADVSTPTLLDNAPPPLLLIALSLAERLNLAFLALLKQRADGAIRHLAATIPMTTSSPLAAARCNIPAMVLARKPADLTADHSLEECS